MTAHRLVAALVTALAPVFAFPAAAAEPGPEAAVRQADIDLCRAVAAHDRERFAALVAEDATFYGRQLLHGRAAVVAGWAPLLDPASGHALTWSPRRVVVAGGGDLAYSLGEYTARAARPDGLAALHHGAYVTVWQRGADGAWRVAVDAGTGGDADVPWLTGAAPRAVERCGE